MRKFARLTRMAKAKRGVSAMAFTLMVGLMAVTAIGSITIVGDRTKCIMESSASKIGGAAGKPAPKTLACGATAEPAEPGFSFVDVSGAEPNGFYTSNAMTLSGYQGTATLRVSGGRNATLVRNGSDTGAAEAEFAAGQTLAIRQQADSGFLTGNTASLSGAGASGSWTVTTREIDLTPDPFTFSDQSGVNPNTVVTSGTVTLSGFDGPQTASISGGGTFSVDGGPFVTTASVSPGQTIALRLTSSASSQGSVSTIFSLGTASSPWTVATRILDLTPDAFSFVNATGIDPSAVTASNSVTVNGFDGPISVSSDNGAEVSVAGGGFTSVASINPGETLQLRLTASSSPLTTVSTNLTLGTATVPWSVTTRAADLTPDTFSFASQSNISISTQVSSNTVTVNGFDGPLTVSISGGGAQLSVNGGSFTTSASINPGDTLTLRVTSSSSPSTTVTPTVTLGTASVNWSVTTTAPDTTPDPFSFSNQSNASLNTTITSNAVTVSGFDGPLTASCNGYCTAIARNGSWGGSSYSGFYPGDTITIRMTSDGNYSSSRTASVTLGSTTSSTWSVTTLALTPGNVGSPTQNGSSANYGVYEVHCVTDGNTTNGISSVSAGTGSLTVNLYTSATGRVGTAVFNFNSSGVSSMSKGGLGYMCWNHSGYGTCAINTPGCISFYGAATCAQPTAWNCSSPVACEVRNTATGYYWRSCNHYSCSNACGSGIGFAWWWSGSPG